MAVPIALHPENPHYFLYHGRAVALVSSGEHYGAVLNAAFDYRRYLATLAADNLNYARLFGGAYVEVPAQSFGILRNDLAPAPGQFAAPWARSETPGYRGGGNKFDLTRWNDAYFERYRSFLAEAQRLGIIVEVTFFSSHYDEKQWDLSPFHAANNVNGTPNLPWKTVQTLENGALLPLQEAYTRKLVREANSFDNVIFEIQNEPWSDRGTLAGVVNPYLPAPGRDLYPNSIDLPDARSLAWQARVSGWVQSEERALPNHHLLAQNYSNFGFPVSDPLPGVSIINFHYAYPNAVGYNYGLNKAISYDETGFLGHSDAQYRRQAWNFMLAGGSVFDGLDYSFSAGHEAGDDTEPNGPGGGSPALRHQLRSLAAFLAALPLTRMTPDGRLVAHASGVRTQALSAPGNVYSVYLDGSGPCELQLLLPAGDYRVEWVDPATGSTVATDRFAHSGGEKTLRSPPFAEDMALRIFSQAH